MITVTFVGAGSVEFTRNVVTDLCGYPEFRGREGEKIRIAWKEEDVKLLRA